MSGTSAGWSKERRAKHSADMVERNRDPDFAARRRKGQATRTPEQRAEKSELMKRQNADPAFQQKRRAGIVHAHRTFFIPEHAHPLVRGLFVEMNAQRATREANSCRSGVSKYSLTNWRTRVMPQVDTLDAALNALGFELVIAPIGHRDENGFYTSKKKGSSE